MSYTQFSTDNADYYLVYNNHLDTNTNEIFKQSNLNNLDAIILESSGISPKNPIAIEFEKLIKRIEHSEKSLPIYLVDIDLNLGGYLISFAFVGLHFGIGYKLCKSAENNFKRKTNRREFLKGGFKLFAGMAIFSGYLKKAVTVFGDGKGIPILNEAEAVLDNLPPTQLFGLRNAIAARKTEEFIAPRLKKQFKRKPVIALVYGGGHSGLESNLKHKRMRDMVIESYKATNYLGIEKDKLNLILEIYVKNNTRKRIKVNLF
jgi:hypothetical protein